MSPSTRRKIKSALVGYDPCGQLDIKAWQKKFKYYEPLVRMIDSTHRWGGAQVPQDVSLRHSMELQRKGLAERVESPWDTVDHTLHITSRGRAYMEKAEAVMDREEEKAVLKPGQQWGTEDCFDYLDKQEGRRASGRALTASDRYTLIRLASTMTVGSPERKAILNGLKTAETVRGRRASVTLADRMKHDKQTAKMIGRILDRTVDEWEKATSTLFLNDLSKAYNQIDDFESIANRMKSRLGDLWASHIDGHGMADFYDEVADSGHYDLYEAYEAAQQEIQEMVDDGMADDGYEDAVQERIENSVLPILEDAIAQFQRDHDVSKYRVDYRRHEKEEAAVAARRENALRQIAEMEAKIKRLRSTL